MTVEYCEDDRSLDLWLQGQVVEVVEVEAVYKPGRRPAYWVVRGECRGLKISWIRRQQGAWKGMRLEWSDVRRLRPWVAGKRFNIVVTNIPAVELTGDLFAEEG